MQRSNIVYGIGAILLGLVGLTVADFALQWQPVPPFVPARSLLASIVALAFVLAGAASLVPRFALRGIVALAVLYSAWLILLMLPPLLLQPYLVIRWNAFCEVLALTSAGFVAWSGARPRLLRPARLAFGFGPLVFGTAHFVYADFTAAMIPGWIPFPLFWAYATGCFHIAAGLSILTGRLAPLGSSLLAVMFGCFVLLLHVPRVVHASESRLEWTMLAVAVSLTGSAVIVAASYRATRIFSFR